MHSHYEMKLLARAIGEDRHHFLSGYNRRGYKTVEYAQKIVAILFGLRYDESELKQEWYGQTVEFSNKQNGFVELSNNISKIVFHYDEYETLRNFVMNMRLTISNLDDYYTFIGNCKFDNLNLEFFHKLIQQYNLTNKSYEEIETYLSDLFAQECKDSLLFYNPLGE